VSIQNLVGAALGVLVGAVGLFVGASEASDGADVGATVSSPQGKLQVLEQIGAISLPSSVCKLHLTFLFATQVQSRVVSLIKNVPVKSKHSRVGEEDGAGETVGKGVGASVGNGVGFGEIVTQPFPNSCLCSNQSLLISERTRAKTESSKEAE
jgi:hypothetical protein